MRTLALTVMLVVVAVATGASFVVRAQEPATSAALDAGCEPRDRPSGVDVLLTCTFAATNTGSETIVDADIGFVPAGSLPIPDRYYFWSWRLDGGPLQDAHPYQLAYALGDIPAGGRRVLEIEVIVRATQRSGADAVLTDGSGARELARRTLASDVTAATPDVRVELDVREMAGTDGVYDATLSVTPSMEVTLVTAGVGLDDGWRIDREFLRPDGLPPAVTPGKLPLYTTEISPHSNPGETQTDVFRVRAPDGCTGGTIAVVAHVETVDGRVLRPALLKPVEYDDTCYMSGQGGGGSVEPSGLPAGGYGPRRDSAGSLDLATAVAVAGVMLTAGGLWLRRARTP